MNPSSTGLVSDNRTPFQKEFDTKISDLYGSDVPQSPQYLAGRPDASTYVKFPWENQLGESSCVAHSRVLNQAIYNSVKRNQPFVQGAPAFVYRLRNNYPTQGMAPSDANSILGKYGVPNYGDCPTPATEGQVNALTITDSLYQLAGKNKSGNWAGASDPTNIDAIAFASNNLGVAVSILIFAQVDEWEIESPTVFYTNLKEEDAVVRHDVTVLPNSAYIENGKRFVIIQDSAQFGSRVYRFVSEDFIKARCQGADIIVELGISSVITLPKHTFFTDLSFGSTGKEVQVLQSCLQSLGFLPTIVNGQLLVPTQYYGGLTKQAVLAFQNAYAAEILAPVGLTSGTGYFGPSTRNFLNSLLSK